MILFHGTNNIFQQFQIDKRFSTHEMLVEGLGVYLTSNIELASGYGMYIYEVEVCEDIVSDFTSPIYISYILNIIQTSLGIRISDYIDCYQLTESILLGNISITKLYKEISDLLDSNENFYLKHSHLITYEDDCLFKKIKEIYTTNIKPVIKYYDSSFKQDIYLCIKNPELLKIKNIQKREC